MSPTQQHYGNHQKMTPLFHYVLAPVTLFVLVGSIVQLIRDQFSFFSILLVAAAVALTIVFVLLRRFATQLQDRIIRQEEQFRHVQLTGRPLDARLSLGQILALRFADDAEYAALCKQAAETGMTPDQIKRAVQTWRADHLRV